MNKHLRLLAMSILLAVGYSFADNPWQGYITSITMTMTATTQTITFTAVPATPTSSISWQNIYDNYGLIVYRKEPLWGTTVPRTFTLNGGNDERIALLAREIGYNFGLIKLFDWHNDSVADQNSVAYATYNLGNLVRICSGNW